MLRIKDIMTKDVYAVEADASVVDEHRHLVVRDLGEDVDRLDPRELGGVRHRLARDEHERLADRAVAGARQLDSNAVHLFDVRGDVRQRGDERGGLVAERPLAVEPAAQLALLPPGK